MGAPPAAAAGGAGHGAAGLGAPLAPPASGPAKPPRRASVVASAEGGERVREFCARHGGSRPVTSVLIANNGLGAVKFIRSVRAWASKALGDERAVALVAMASAEDLRVGAEHVRMADQFVEVPAGASNNNCANVRLIVETAEEAGVGAVWPGWGHASEYPELPRALQAAGIAFLGPPEGPMAALGDKVGSSILAQAAGVPTLPWSGSHVSIAYEECGGEVPEELYVQACLTSPEECVAACQRIGYPVMLKASWGGGGKGIRRVGSDEEAARGLKQVQAELPGSPIFAMKLAGSARHLEVQLLADQHGQVCAIHSRDCSTQRRHQKIVEEGPVTVAPPETLRKMEEAACELARHVKYVGAATVEWLFSPDSGGFHFLELNPRLQVEHPVTEWISGVNLPSCQLMVGMGIPLDRIPDIRRLFGRDPGGADPIDFTTARPVPPAGHVVAARITSEDATDGFKPTCGSIEEISFQPTPDVWGYFSVKPGGGIHEFADSQFGHIFAKGENRSEAIQNMSVALGDLKIRGEISNIAGYVRELITGDDFRGNRIDTGWLDRRIAAQVKMGGLPWHIPVLAGAAYRASRRVGAASAEFLESLKKGQIPPPVSMKPFSESMVVDGVKYSPRVALQGPGQFRISLGGKSVDVVCRPLNDGGLRLQLDGNAVTVHAEETAVGTRLQVGSRSSLLEDEKDPSRLISVTAGKFVKWLVRDGEKVGAGQPFAEVEVMKMLMPLVSDAAGSIHCTVHEGEPIVSGQLLGTLDLDDPSSVKKAQPFTGAFPELGPPRVVRNTVSSLFCEAMEAAKQVLSGYERPAEAIFAELSQAVESPDLARSEWSEALAVIATRIPASLAREMEAVLSRYTRELGAWKGSGAAGSGVDPPRFPSAPLLDAISACVEAAPAAERAALEATVEGLRSIARAHSRGSRAHTRHIAQEFLNVFLDVEEVFEGRSLADAVEELRGKNHSPEEILAAVLAHQGSACRHEFVLRLLNAAVAAEPRGYRGELRRLATLENPQNVQVAHRAKQMLEQSVMTGLQALVSRALSMDDMTEEAAPGAAPASPGSPTRLGSFSRVGSRKIQRKATRTETLFSGLEEKLTSQFMDGRRTELATTQAAVEEALASLLGHDDAEVRTRALLTYVERVYYPFLDKATLGVREVAGLQVATWRYSHATDAGGRGAEHAAAIALLPSLSRLPDVVKGLQGEQLEVLHLAVTGPIERASELSKSASRLFTASMKQMEADGLPNFAQPQSGSESDSELGAAGGPESAARYALALTAALNSEAHALAGLGVASVSALRPGGPTGVVRRWGFVQNADSGAYEPDPWTRPQGRWQVEPPVARLLELSRLGPQTALYCPSRDRQWHLYVASEKPQGGARGAALSRVFLRGVIRQISAQELALAVSTGQARPAALTGAVVNGLEPALCSALDELERAHFDDHSRARRADWVHIFFSVLPVRLPGAEGTAEAQEVADALRAATLAVARRRSASLRHLKIAGWEFRVRSSEGGAWRVCVSSPSGFEDHDNVDIYREGRAASGGVVYEPVAVAGSTCGALAGLPVSAAYAPLEGLQRRRLAAKRLGTTYVYDFPALFAAALGELWQGHLFPQQQGLASSARSSPREPVVPPGAGPVFQAQELALDPAVLRAGGEAMWTAPLAPVETVAGGNRVGMVAWEWRMRTPEYPNGRRVVVVSNDVSHSAGAFGPQEDAVFKAAVDYSLERKLPLVYLAANSGARFGVASEVRDRFKIQWRDENDRARGVDYLYLEDADYQIVRDSVAVEGPLRGPKTSSGNGGAQQPPRWKITGIIGQEDGLGVECLSGSGAIAAAFAKAYREGFTLTFVSARTVGIGAYLARLGHRVVQRSDQPIILTGFAALNKLLGRAVYTSHLQLGGPRVMGYNGVTHVTVPDDLAGARTVLEWLAYVPDVLGGETPAVLEPVVDPVERDVAYGAGELAPGAKLNPRAAIEGGRDNPGDEWAPGLFDRGSWTELQSGWARTVITGLARLGGLPVGVVAVETSTVNVDVPADPGDASSSAKTVPQAGQIWFPDSAAKTAQAMEEFARQGLPLFILANWRGFSGGMRDLFEGVLQQGSLIVENLRTYPHPVFVYLPRGAELRGGAWVVVDRRINPDQVEMYADPSARGNVLEPEGMAEIKFREPDLLKTIRRLEPAGSSGGGSGAGKSSKEKGLLPAYKQAALHFMDLHDVPERMLAKDVLQAAVPWEKSRQFFYWRLKARLMEERLFKEMELADPALSLAEKRALLAEWQGRRPDVAGNLRRSGSTGAFEEYQLRSRTDIDFVTWAALEKEAVRERLQGLRRRRQVAELQRLGVEVGLDGGDVRELLSKLAL